MSEAHLQENSARKVRTLEQEIALQRDKLKRLEDRQREQQRKDREKNQKAVLELIRAEKLDTVSATQWRNAMPAIRAALQLQAPLVNALPTALPSGAA